MADDKYCSYHLTKLECEKNKNDGCSWLENGHTPLWGDSIGKQICVDKDEYNRKSSVFTSKDDWNKYVKKVELQKKTENIAGNIQNAKQEAQDKLKAEILSRGKQIKDNLIETNVEVRKVGQEAQDKFKGILSRGKQIEDNLKETNVEVRKAKQEAQDKLEEILLRGKQKGQDKLEKKNNDKIQNFLSNIKNVGKNFLGIGGSINRSPNLYSITKQHYLNLKSTY